MASLAEVKMRERLAAGPRPISSRENRQLTERFPGIKAARFDLQFTTEENRQLWALSDLTSVDAAANFMVRRTLRMRCRYAYHNNPFAMGMANRLAKFVIGTGPQLHLCSGKTDADKKADQQVEDGWNKWFQCISGPKKLRTSRTARVYNGEGVNLLRTNPQVKHPVKLDMFEIEADQMASPLYGVFPSQYPDQWFDGKVLDPWGNPEVYHILRQHPGAFGAFVVMGWEFDAWPARFVMHDYASLRPAQQRGIPDMAPVAQDYEELRRYAKSVLGASEKLSDWVGFIKSQEAPNPDDPDEESGFGDATQYVKSRRGSFGVLPRGYGLDQLRAEQPTLQYPDYVLAKLIEISQITDMPLFLVAGDARVVNMSSAYVVSQSFWNSINIERQEYGTLLDLAFTEYMNEARHVPGLIPYGYPDDADRSYRWPRPIVHADPQKVAASVNMRIKNGLAPSMAWAEEGIDFDEMAARAARDFGVKDEEWKLAYFQSMFAERGQPPPASEEGEPPPPGRPQPQNQNQ